MNIRRPSNLALHTVFCSLAETVQFLALWQKPISFLPPDGKSSASCSLEETVQFHAP